MRKIVLFLLSAVVVVGLLAIYNYSKLGEKGSPIIQITPSSYHFGDIPFKKVEKNFSIKNKGEKVLTIEELSTSCSCTKAEVESTQIPPKGTTTLTVTFDPKLMGEKLEGEIFRVIYIKSNDPNNPEATVEIRANIREEPGENKGKS